MAVEEKKKALGTTIELDGFDIMLPDENDSNEAVEDRFAVDNEFLSDKGMADMNLLSTFRGELSSLNKNLKEDIGIQEKKPKKQSVGKTVLIEAIKPPESNAQVMLTYMFSFILLILCGILGMFAWNMIH